MWHLLAVGVLSIAAVEVEVKPLSGPAIAGNLVELSSEQLVLETSDGRRSLELQELLVATARGADEQLRAVPQIWVDLVDGSELLATDFSVTGGIASIGLLGGGRVETPTRSIRSVLLKDPGKDGELHEQWREIVDSRAVGDLIVIRKSAALDHLEGVLYEIDAETVEFEFDGARINVPRHRLDGLVYFHPVRRELPEPICRVIDASGSQWTARSLRLENGRLELIAVAGVKFDLPLDRLKKLDFSTGNVVYLSDLEPASVQWTPFFESRITPATLAELFAPRADRSFDGGELLLGGEAYEKGLALHSRTLIVYRLPGDFRRLRAAVGIDDRVREAGHVQLVVSGDGRRLFDETITGKMEPLYLDLDIHGVRRLSILVDFGEELDLADHLNLCDARITK